jgi:pimeloyl-ACP methyl ester carboxylesterase
MMNEASSKFVDNLALERLITKISQVRHSPDRSVFVREETPFHWIEHYHLDISAVSARGNNQTKWFEIPSLNTASPYPENDTVYLYYYPASNPSGNVLLLHGLFDDNMFNYAYLIKLLNEVNFNVFFMVLPYHLQRKPAASSFSGEYFLSADIYRFQRAFQQAVYDIEASLQWIQHYNEFPTILAGFSMGGAVAFRYSILRKRAIGTFLINPVTDLSGILWDNPLLITVGQDLQNSGFDMKTSAAIFKELDPCENLRSDFNGRNIAMIYSLYDQIIAEDKNKMFIQRTGIQNVHRYHAGHLNILRVPKLAMDIRDFFLKLH